MTALKDRPMWGSANRDVREALPLFVWPALAAPPFPAPPRSHRRRRYTER